MSDIIEVLEISQLTFLRYLATKSAVLVGFPLEGIARVTEELRATWAADTKIFLRGIKQADEERIMFRPASRPKTQES